MIREAILKVSDKEMDDIIKDRFNGKVFTYHYDFGASIELANRLMVDVLVTKDKKFLHIPSELSQDQKKSLKEIEKEFKLKEVK